MKHRWNYIGGGLLLLLLTATIIIFPNIYYPWYDQEQAGEYHMESFALPDQEASPAQRMQLLGEPGAVWSEMNLAYVDVDSVMADMMTELELLNRMGYEKTDLSFGEYSVAFHWPDIFQPGYYWDQQAFLTRGYIVSGMVDDIYVSVRLYQVTLWRGFVEIEGWVDPTRMCLLFDGDTMRLCGVDFYNYGGYDMIESTWLKGVWEVLLEYEATRASLTEDAFDFRYNQGLQQDSPADIDSLEEGQWEAVDAYGCYMLPAGMDRRYIEDEGDEKYRLDRVDDMGQSAQEGWN